MNIKSLLLGSAAALAAVTGAQAADAIVAAEPEALEYVRVCDAFGTGYFYIPGTETCLKIGGRVRTQIEYKEDYNLDEDGRDPTLDGADWNPYSRGYLTISVKSDTEFGALSSYINLQADTDKDAFLDGAWINVAGFDVGYFYNWWDEYGIEGETENGGGNLFNSVRYTYDAGPYFLGASVEALSGALVTLGTNDDVGISGIVGGTLGGVTVRVLGSYDFDAEESAYKAVATIAVGPGSLEFLGTYATGKSVYWDASEWSVAAAYHLKATDKLTITPGVQYFGDDGFVDGTDSWKAGLTAGYQITEGLSTLATVNYADGDAKDEAWTGFLRLQRDF